MSPKPLSEVGLALSTYYGQIYKQDVSSIISTIFSHFSTSDDEFSEAGLQAWKDNPDTQQTDLALRSYYSHTYGLPLSVIEEKVVVYFALADREFDKVAFGKFFEQTFLPGHSSVQDPDQLRAKLLSLLPANAAPTTTSQASDEVIQACPFLNAIQNLPRERSETDEVVAAFESKVRDYRCPAYSGDANTALRGVHPKSYGVVSGIFTIVDEQSTALDPNIPVLSATLRSGLFKEAGRQIQCKMRYSGSGGMPFEILDDGYARQSHGLALKLLSLEGNTLHDILLNNAPIFPSKEPRSAIAQKEESLDAGTLKLMDDVLANASDPGQPLLMQQFSISAYAWGDDHAVKYAVFPPPPSSIELSQEDRATYEQILTERGPDFRSKALQLAVQRAEAIIDLNFCVQFANPEKCPTDDETVEWTTPWHQVGRIRIAPQNLGDASDEHLVFNSYHISSAAHLPIGRLNRARLWAYTKSASTRHENNKVERAPHPYVPPNDLKVAVVGGGASGLCAALALSEFGYQVTVYEKRGALGGHATSRAVHGGKHFRDPAFGAFRKRQWPNFWALLKTLNIEPISLGQCENWFDSPFVSWFHEDGSPLVHSPSVMEEGRIFAAALSKAIRNPESDGQTVGELIDELSLSPEFVNTWFIGGVILYFGGHPIQHYLDYPLRLIAWMWQNSIAEQTTEPLELFRVKDSDYITAFAQLLQTRGVTIHTGAEVTVETRNHDGVSLNITLEGMQPSTQTFGDVILAIQPQYAAQVMGQHATEEEKKILQGFEYSVDTVVVHQDTSYMPKDSNQWKLANIRLPNPGAPQATRDQTLPYTLCAPCNQDDATPVLATYDYAHTDHWDEGVDKFTFSHAVVNPNTQRLRQRLQKIQGTQRIHYCGSWLRGLTLHEDAVVTGFETANRILGSRGEYRLLEPPLSLPKPFEEFKENKPDGSIDLSSGIPAIEKALVKIIQGVVSIDATELNGETDVQALGMSSLHFAKLANTINTSLPPTAEEEIDITMLLQMETLFEVAEYIHMTIHGQVADQGDKAGTHQEPTHSAKPDAEEPQPKRSSTSRRKFINSLEDKREQESAIAMPVVMAIQGMAILCLFATVALCANLAFWVGSNIYSDGNMKSLVLALPAAWSTYCLAYSAAAVLTKWLVVGRLKPGRYLVYRRTHLKWWIANLFLNFGQQSIWLPFRDSHLALWLLQLLGGKVHSGATLNIDGLNPAVSLVDADLLSIGDRAYIRRGALLQCHLFVEGSFILAPITLEERTVVWTRGVVEPGCVIEKTGILEHHSVLTMGNTLPAGMRAQGVPAVATERHQEDGVKAGSGVDKFVHTFMGFIVLPYLLVSAVGLFYFLMTCIVDNPTLHTFDWRVWLSLWPVFIVNTVILGAITCLFKWLMIGKLKPGQNENDLSVRLSIVKFVTFLMMRFALFCPRDLRWMLVRAMGGKVAYGSVTDCPLVEVAYADLLTMEEGSFYSPAAYADFAAFRDGKVILEEVRLESTAYVGAYSTVSAPVRLPPLSLLASTSTLATGTKVESSQVWVGSPARCVPITLGEVTDTSHSMGGWSLIKNRIIDLSNHYFVVLLMSSVALTGYHLFADTIWPLDGPIDLQLRTLASFGFILFSYMATTFGMLPLLRLDTELLRWLCIKDEEIRTKGFERSTWKFNVWHLLSNHLLPYGMLIDLYSGTPFQLWIARRLGATIGQDVYLANGVGIREFTFTHIRDGVMLNRGAALIAHSELPSGRIIMKDIELDKGSSMGFISYIVGGTRLPEGALLGSLSRPFDSQELDPHGEYDNTPCKRREK